MFSTAKWGAYCNYSPRVYAIGLQKAAQRTRKLEFHQKLRKLKNRRESSEKKHANYPVFTQNLNIDNSSKVKKK